MLKVLTPNPETDSSRPATPAALKTELFRKLFHLCTLVYLAAYLIIGPERIMAAMLPWMAVVWAFEALRFHTSWGRAWVQRWFGFMIRGKEEAHYTGFFYTSLGALLTFAFFRGHPDIVRIALLYLAFGDSASAVVGLAWGRHPFWVFGRKRTWEGSAAGFLAALGIGAANGLPPVLTALGALAFSAADILPLPPDDNVWIPILPGAVLLGAINW
ncbi:MAG: hypothetical protein HZB91_01840 [Elusimicrobia bacterium]|nr:hypothetical protein [Elusimicrobiota bacterium]